MNEELTYKVLWVDDQEEIVESTKLDADEYSIELDHYTNWQEAETALKNNFEDYTAIVLDAFCKVRQDEDIKDVFISAVLPRLARICGEKKRFIPWYILSAGTMENFSRTVEGAEYEHQTSEWGQMLYLKDVPDDDPKNSRILYENILRVGKAQANNIVLFRHRDVFTYLGEGKLIDERARKAMLKMLSALYVPEENIKYEYVGNPLRKVIEFIFRAAKKLGLLTEDCFDEKDHIVLLDANRYLSGLTINCYDGREIKYQARWGKAGTGKDGSGGEFVFPSEIAMLVKNILNYSSSESHTYEEKPYLIDEQNKELFFGYLMQLCHVIKWFGQYASDNSDIERNKKMQRVIGISKDSIKSKTKDELIVKKIKKEDVGIVTSVCPTLEEIIGKQYLVMKDGKTLYCGNCKLDASLHCKEYQKVTLVNAIPNEGEDKDRFAYIATEIK